MALIEKNDFLAAHGHKKAPIHRFDRTVAPLAREADFNRDAVLSGPDELGRVFDLIDAYDGGTPGEIQTIGAYGITDYGRTFNTFAAQLTGAPVHGIDTQQELFDTPILEVHVDGWDRTRMHNGALREGQKDPRAELTIYRTPDPDRRPTRRASEKDLIFRTTGAAIKTSGNMTAGTPKASYRVKFTDPTARMVGLNQVTLKSMWNDVSQMREAIAWDLFAKAGVHAPRHTYARATLNEKYLGLYSVIEGLDVGFLAERFGANWGGNLYEGVWIQNVTDLGPATLEHRVGENGNDSGNEYRIASDMDNRTYQLKTNKSDKKASNYNDLASFIRTINGVGLPGVGDAKFNTLEYQQSVEDVFDAKTFLRWAGVNMLLGSWDNYYRTPSNYFLYNSGKQDAPQDFMEKPYFHFIPWDYDNSLGIDYSNVAWQYKSIVDWEGNTEGIPDSPRSKLPLITNLLKNDTFKQYYLDHLEHLLDTSFNVDAIKQVTGDDWSEGGLWKTIRGGVYAEAESNTAAPHTGRQWTNSEVYHSAVEQAGVDRGAQRIEGIEHFVRMRHDSARAELAELRQQFPKGASGATFPAQPELPAS